MPLPDMSATLKQFEQTIQLHVVTQTVVNFRPVESEATTPIQAVVQPANKEKLNPSIVDWSLRYMLVHSSSVINIGDFMTHDGIKYKAVDYGPYSNYGFNSVVFEQIK